MLDVHAKLNVGLPLQESLQQETDSFHQKIGFNSSKKLVKCYICGTALYGAETWVLCNVDLK